MNASRLWTLCYNFFNVLIDLGNFFVQETYIPILGNISPIEIMFGVGVVWYLGFTVLKYFK